MKKHYRPEDDCLNCGAVLQGKFCHVCGQENLQVKESFGHMMNHAISDYFHFDHQFFNTLKPLLFSPGKLTNEYMAGKRVSYLHPVKMYIFISFIYFLVLFTENKSDAVTGRPITTEKTKADSIIAKKPNLTDEQKKGIYNLYDYTVTKGKNGKENDTTYHNMQTFVTKSTKDTSYTQYLSDQAKLPATQQDGFFKRHLVEKVLDLKKHGAEGGNTLVEAFKHYVPKMMFLLLPIFALILKVTFSKNKKFYVEHLIYSFHFHCFIFLLLTVCMLIELAAPMVNWDFLNFIAFAIIIWYTYRSLKVVYNRTPGRTISKMIGISFSYSAALIICMSLLFIIVALLEV